MQGTVQLTVAFCTRVALEAWVASKREGSRWRLRNFIVAAEGRLRWIREELGVVESRALCTFRPRAFLHSWCVAQLPRNCIANASRLGMTHTMVS